MASWRYLAQNLLTGDMLTTSLRLARTELSWALSGPGALAGTVDPLAPGTPAMSEWQTALYAEADGQIRWGGILQGIVRQGSQLKLDAAGFTSYSTDVPYVGPLYTRIGADPTQVTADLWAHVQSFPTGNLGLSVVRQGACPVRVGTALEPYVLDPLEAPDVGQELASLASSTPFDYREDHAWVADGSSAISHTLVLGWPRLGGRRTDLRFVQGVNVVGEPVPVARDAAGYSNHLYGLGKGEGAAMVRADVSAGDGRLRRPRVVTDKLAATRDRLSATLRTELRRRSLDDAVGSITVREHPNAPIGSWQVGDDVDVESYQPWDGAWSTVTCRILSWSLGETDTRATLQLARSSSFAYGGAQ